MGDEKTLMSFEAAYGETGINACRQLVELQKSGLHDFRLKLREKEITHEAIVELDDKLKELEALITQIYRRIDGNEGGVQ